MSIYHTHILPYLINKLCATPPVMAYRKKIVPNATGRVLEIGIGSGINLPLYDASKVSSIVGLDPSPGMERQAQKNLARTDIPVEWLPHPAEAIPLPDSSVDSITLTFTLCTIPDWQTALSEMKRVLAPEGKIHFCEHGHSPDNSVARWQDRINPFWRPCAGGCNLNRPIVQMMEQAGLQVKYQTEYMRGVPKFVGYIYYGEATVQD